MARLAPLGLAITLLFGACTTTQPVDQTSTSVIAGTSTTTESSEEGPAETTQSSGTETTVNATAPSSGSIVVVVDLIRAVGLADTAARYTAASGVEVILDVQPHENIRARASDPDVDIFIGPHIWRDALLDEGLISVVDGLDPDRWSQKATEAFTITDGMVAVPFSAESVVLYVRSDKERAVPNDLLGACEDPRPCFVMPGFGEAGGYHVTSFLMAGARQGLEAQLHDPAALSAGLGAFMDIAESDDHVLTTVSAARADFLRSARIFVGGPWDLGPIEDSGISFEVLPLPNVGSIQLSAPVAVQGFYLSANAPNTSAASSFLLDVLAGDQTQRDLWLRDRRAPVHADLDDLGSIADAFSRGVDQGFLLPQGDLEIYWEELGAALEQIYTGADPLEAIAAAVVRIDERIRAP